MEFDTSGARKWTMTLSSTLNRALLGLHIIKDSFGVASYAHVDALDHEHIFTKHIGSLQLMVFNPVDNQILGADVGLAAAHTEPDKMVLGLFYTVGADVHQYPCLNFYMGRCMFLLADIALTNVTFHLLPPFSGYRLPVLLFLSSSL